MNARHIIVVNDRTSQLSPLLITLATPSVPAILSILNQSYFEYKTRHVTSDGSMPSSKNGYDRNSV